MSNKFMMRALNAQEVAEMKVLVKDPTSKRTVLDHIMNGKLKTNHISFTTDYDIALDKYGRDKKTREITANYFAIAKIDEVTNQMYDFSNEETLDRLINEVILNGETTLKFESHENEEHTKKKALGCATEHSEVVVTGNMDENVYIIVKREELNKFVREDKKYLHFTSWELTDLAGEYFWNKQ